uniref:Enoyl reductase (ER) domain-containing protein n=1 Tax=Arion vulgaris TaxID=1028688 RepID=A0A0B7B9H8_9EUPU
MRAIRVASFGGAENLKVETNVPIPTPGPNEVLVKVSVAGVNPVDTYIRSGGHARSPALPYTPGMDSAGVVEEVGSGVTNFKKGDRVLTVNSISGSYAEYATVNALHVSHLEDNLSFSQGASVGIPYYTAYKSLFFRAFTKPGETVLVHGASGAVGIAALQIGRAYGLRLIGTAGTPEGIELIKKNGAEFAFNHREEGYLQKLQETVGEVDVILEMLSNVNLQNDLGLVSFRGRIVVIGCRGPIEINPRLTMTKESSITGVSIMSSTEPEWRIMHAALEAGQKSNWLNPIVAKVYPLSEAAQAQRDVINNTGTTGNLVIDVTK